MALAVLLLVFALPACRKKSVSAGENHHEAPPPPPGDDRPSPLQVWFASDSTACFADFYQRLGYEALWGDSSRLAELNRLTARPWTLGLPEDKPLKPDGFQTAWNKLMKEEAHRDLLLEELAHTQRLFAWYQGALSGALPGVGIICPDSVQTERLIALVQAPSLAAGLREVLPRELAVRLAWVDRFLADANLAYDPVPVPDFKKDSAACMTAVRENLRRYGLLDVPDSLFTADTLLAAVRQFQRENGLNDDGVIGQRTRNALARTNVERLGHLLANVERARLQAHWTSAKVYVEVNVPEFAVRLYKDGEVVRRHRVIVGIRKKHLTPVFQASMNEIVLNPTWTVPYSIATKELLPSIKRDASYLPRHEYKVYNRSGHEVNPYSVDWQALSTGNFPYTLVQQPGKINALGTIKFLFPNPHSVYLHDTPSRHLFDREERDFSHGCIRLDNPYPLALKILEYSGWPVDSATFFQLLDLQMLHSIPIRPVIPVFVKYLSVRESENGDYLIFYDDLYGRDAEWVARARKLRL